MSQIVKCYLCGVRIDLTLEDHEELPILHGSVVWAQLGCKKELVCAMVF